MRLRGRLVQFLDNVTEKLDGQGFDTGFLRIRYFGLLANRHRSQFLQLCRSHLQASSPPPAAPCLVHLCPNCHHGVMRVIAALSPTQLSNWLAEAPQAENSS